MKRVWYEGDSREECTATSAPWDSLSGDQIECEAVSDCCLCVRVSLVISAMSLNQWATSLLLAWLVIESMALRAMPHPLTVRAMPRVRRLILRGLISMDCCMFLCTISVQKSL